MLETSKLELKTLANEVTVPSIDGRFFCSSRDPLKEAQNWFKTVERTCAGHDQVVVLGLGAGFHILPLLKLNLKIYTFEVEQALVDAWPLKDQIQFISEDFQTDAIVLEFRPAWSGNEKLYSEVSRRIRGLQVAALKSQAESKDLWVLAQSLQNSNLPENLEISIKEIAEMIPVENQTEEARLWRALRELVV